MALAINKAPSGKFCFVGNVPWELAYTMADGSPLTFGAIQSINQCGPGILGKTIKSVRFDTIAEAKAAAQKIGAKVTQILEK